MVAFELSVAHLLNVVMLNNLSNEVFRVLSLWAWSTLRMYSRLCLGRSVLSDPFPWRRAFSIPYSFLNVYWPFRNSDSSVPVVAEWQCGSHCVFSFYVKVARSRVTYLLIPLLLTAWFLLKHVLRRSNLYVVQGGLQTTVSCVSEIEATYKRFIVCNVGLGPVTEYCRVQ